MRSIAPRGKAASRLVGLRTRPSKTSCCEVQCLTAVPPSKIEKSVQGEKESNMVTNLVGCPTYNEYKA